MTTKTEDTTAVLLGVSLVGAKEVRGGNGAIHATDPRTGMQLEPAFSLVGEAEVAEAAELAWEAFASYRQTSPRSRAAFLETVAANIEGLGGTLIERVVQETGIARMRVEGELARTVGQLRLFGRVLDEGSWHEARIDRALPDRKPLPRPDLRLRKVPLGPVAVFGASNFPLAFSVAGGDTASALAAGCPVVVKAHSSHPGTSELVGRAIRAAVAEHGLHEGVFSLLFGDGASVGTALAKDPRIKAVGFTGSRNAGTALVAAAASRPEPIPVYAEMSSINPVFVLPEALAVRGAQLGREWVASLTTGVGQLCTSPGLVFLPDAPGASYFLDAASEALRAAEPAPMLSRHIRDAFEAASVELAAKRTVAEVARGAADPSIACCGHARILLTDAASFLADEGLQTEMFGPASLVVSVPEDASMAALLDRLEGQLTITVQAEGAEPGTSELLAQAELKAGRIIFNGWPTGVEVCDSMVHGGPFPATSQPQTTSVGTLAIDRFLRPVSYQNVPGDLLPAPVRDENPLAIPRRIDGSLRLP